MPAETFGPWTWIDPGAFALVGAGAFMGGVTRMTVALAVIMIEVGGCCAAWSPGHGGVMAGGCRCQWERTLHGVD